MVLMDDAALIMGMSLFARVCSKLGGYRVSTSRVAWDRGHWGSRFSIYKTSVPSRSRRMEW